MRVIGPKGSGKTFLIENIVERLSQMGFKIFYLKHVHHGDFNVDVEGKDTYRVLASGCNTVVALSDIRIYVNTTVFHEDFKRFLFSLTSKYDFTFIEGHPDRDVLDADLTIEILSEELDLKSLNIDDKVIRLKSTEVKSNIDDIVDFLIEILMSR